MGGMLISQTLSYSCLFSKGVEADKRVSCEALVFTGNRRSAHRQSASVPSISQVPRMLTSSLWAALVCA